ncbi:amino acid:proton symporter, ABT family [Polynucleobacter meluiroseus]|uniref:Amino acid:proton symporter, ABT family n=1 Tax=Polynucleobacter meluiroseus TaxID=1938814 RepID=A0A240E463_9BURK|nr:amino acid permease [Polynucleobacter meluiroseus]SNX29321.1 amino acid:proton symporter, ABT family [Polynucleobacter meluiroseus]
MKSTLLKQEHKLASDISLFSATALGIGGMMGAGLFSLLGLASTHAGTHIPLAFLIGAFAASFSVYSYAKLGATFPSSGGAATFTVMGFGPGLISGGLNLFQYIAYLIAAALYAAGFVEYTNTLFGGNLSPVLLKMITVAVIVICSLINLLGTSLVGKAEMVSIGIVVLSLMVFSALGIEHASIMNFAMRGGSVEGIAVAAGILYINFQGFGVVTNSSSAMKSPCKELPLAMFSALIIVTIAYFVVSTAVILLMPLISIQAHSGHVLAVAAEIVAGQFGFFVISVCALLACAAALNATIFAASNIAADMADKRDISSALAHDVLKNKLRALTVSTIGVIVLTLIFPLNDIGQMASLAFLLVYAVISYGHIRIHQQTGAKPIILWCAIVINLTLFATLMISTIQTAPASAIALLVALLASFGIEAFSRFTSLTGNKPKPQNG